MTAYPNFTQLVESEQSLLDDVRTDRASNGALRGRAMWSALKRRWRVAHFMTSAELDTLYAHYAARRHGAFDFTWSGDGATRSVMYDVSGARVPIVARPLGGSCWSVTVELVEV